jgi:N-alpha-acetyltransferase 30
MFIWAPYYMEIEYKIYSEEYQLIDLMKMIDSELSEPYSIFTYRYFLYNWPKLCILAYKQSDLIGVIVCKADLHNTSLRGYIAMLAVRQEYRRLGIGRELVSRAIETMKSSGVEEIVLETEFTNTPALKLYEGFGFARDKRLQSYYLNGNDAFRLKLWLN